GDAVRYAAAYHAALRSLHTPLTARAGLHVGDVILRENSAADVARGAKPMEVEGIAKATAARIMSLAYAGQTLMSAAAKDALGELAREFDAGARLVCVTGIGGTGKTRLAIRFAWTWLGEFPGGVWFCDLAPARSVDGIAFAVSQALDVPLGKEDPLVQLGNA